MKNIAINVDVLNNFTKSEAESFSDAEVYTDDDGHWVLLKCVRG